jgi:hypothetical protein
MNRGGELTRELKVFVTAASLVAVAIVLITVGVALVAGVGWALITAGVLVFSVSVGGAWALLHEGSQ